MSFFILKAIYIITVAIEACKRNGCCHIPLVMGASPGPACAWPMPIIFLGLRLELFWRTSDLGSDLARTGLPRLKIGSWLARTRFIRLNPITIFHSWFHWPKQKMEQQRNVHFMSIGSETEPEAFFYRLESSEHSPSVSRSIITHKYYYLYYVL